MYGAKKPQIFDAELVNPIMILAKFGEMSMWLIWNMNIICNVIPLIKYGGL